MKLLSYNYSSGSDNIPDGATATEADWTDPDKCSPYTKSKTLAEKAAWDLVAKLPGIPTKM